MPPVPLAPPLWIPAYAGMTKEGAGMTKEGAGMTKEGAGMTKEGAGNITAAVIPA